MVAVCFSVQCIGVRPLAKRKKEEEKTLVVLSRYLFILNLLHCVQKPLWCTNYSTDSCNDREYYYLGELPYLSVEESLIYEVRIRYSEEIYMTSRLLRAYAAITHFSFFDI